MEWSGEGNGGGSIGKEIEKARERERRPWMIIFETPAIGAREYVAAEQLKSLAGFAVTSQLESTTDFFFLFNHKQSVNKPKMFHFFLKFSDKSAQ